MAEYIADTLIFFVAGAVMANKTMAKGITAEDWGNLFVLFIALQFIRGANVLLCWPVLRQGYGVSWQVRARREGGRKELRGGAR